MPLYPGTSNTSSNVRPRLLLSNLSSVAHSSPDSRAASRKAESEREVDEQAGARADIPGAKIDAKTEKVVHILDQREVSEPRQVGVRQETDVLSEGSPSFDTKTDFETRD